MTLCLPTLEPGSPNLLRWERSKGHLGQPIHVVSGLKTVPTSIEEILRTTPRRQHIACWPEAAHFSLKSGISLGGAGPGAVSKVIWISDLL